METHRGRRLTKITLFHQKISRKTSILLAIFSDNKYICQYPDPDACPKYNPKNGFCIDHNVRCSYRKKCKNLIKTKNSKGDKSNEI